MIKACLNGDRLRADHPGVPVTPSELAKAAADAVSAGAQAVHLHPRGADERESLRWDDIRAAVEAVRGSCPGVPVGVSTRQEIVPDLTQRLGRISAWERGPDFASVNFHENGAERVADLLIERGIGVEAGLFTPDAARKYLGWGQGAVRVLVEAIPGISPGADGIAAAQAVLEELGESPLTRDGDSPMIRALVHGEGEWAWPVLRWAAAHKYDVRVGFEDMLTGPEGQPVTSNAELLRYL